MTAATLLYVFVRSGVPKTIAVASSGVWDGPTAWSLAQPASHGRKPTRARATCREDMQYLHYPWCTGGTPPPRDGSVVAPEAIFTSAHGTRNNRARESPQVSYFGRSQSGARAVRS